MVSEEGVSVRQFNDDNVLVKVVFVPTVPHCSLASIIGKLLAHLGLHRQSSVCLRRPHYLDIFSSETTGSIEAKFHMESPWDGGRKFVQTVLVT